HYLPIDCQLCISVTLRFGGTASVVSDEHCKVIIKGQDTSHEYPLSGHADAEIVMVSWQDRHPWRSSSSTLSHAICSFISSH
ncbi:hypothetical protein PMAYCL1PPCAC_10804, partial [Pristionchus mayeri]